VEFGVRGFFFGGDGGFNAIGRCYLSITGLEDRLGPLQIFVRREFMTEVKIDNNGSNARQEPVEPGLSTDTFNPSCSSLGGTAQKLLVQVAGGLTDALSTVGISFDRVQRDLAEARRHAVKECRK
jgi:hypothetical protein